MVSIERAGDADADAEEIRELFHRLWSRAATGDKTYDKAEWKRLAALLSSKGIRT
jgi:hypothetical protein